jgi:hypothetical protein
MSLFLGNNSLSNVFLGSSEVQTVYSGTSLVYQKLVTPVIPTNGLQLYLNPATGSSWPGSGSILYDLSGNGRNFRLVGSPPFTGSNSFNYNGSNYLTSSNAGLNVLSATSSFSIYTFFKPSTTSTVTNVQQVISKNQTSPNYMGWAVGYNTFTGGSEGRWGLDFLGDDGGLKRINVDTTTAYQTSLFVGNCITYNGNANASGVKLYFNAVSGAVATTVRSNTMTSTANPQTTAPTNVAGRDNSTNFYGGRIGAILMYNRELTSTEVSDIYSVLSSSFTN